MKLSKELLNQVTLHTDTIYEEELDEEHVEDLIKDLLYVIKLLNQDIDDFKENLEDLKNKNEEINDEKYSYSSYRYFRR